ncbi:hypothetical protein BBJ28_00004350 [Nothophytophthora sp. Chile5]|nr:hypothetical protein BBJ28_00004350 [Nothophytophthora sp. Chile5]
MATTGGRRAFKHEGRVVYEWEQSMEELDPMAQEATKRQMMLERFQEENPGFDFSNAEFNGAAPDPRTFMGGVKYTQETAFTALRSERRRCYREAGAGRSISMPVVDKKADGNPSSAGGNAGGASRTARQVRSGGEPTRQAATSSKSGGSNGNGGVVSSSSLRFKTNFRNTIYDTLLRRGWKETTESDWDFYWADREYIYDLLDTVHLDNGQRVNHYRNGREMEKKAKYVVDYLSEETATVEADTTLGSYDFFPVTYILPGEYAIFVEEFKRNQGIWIMKPIGKYGKGIFLFTKLSQISDWRTDFRWRPENQQVETYVVQRYISNPYLVGGKKFDLRLYALVPSFFPLEIYLFRGGFARFTNSRYSNNPSDIANSFIHLTNVAVQKTSENYNKKWDLRNLKLFMMSKHGPERINQLFHEIELKIIMNDKHCFELYGYDVMIDENLKPWLLEVNASPSLKCGMLNDMLDIIDLENQYVLLDRFA